jgi:hypothetical protein
MRNWHHNLIKLDQALALINTSGLVLNRVVISVIDGGYPRSPKSPLSEVSRLRSKQ